MAPDKDQPILVLASNYGGFKEFIRTHCHTKAEEEKYRYIRRFTDVYGLDHPRYILWDFWINHPEAFQIMDALKQASGIQVQE